MALKELRAAANRKIAYQRIYVHKQKLAALKQKGASIPFEEFKRLSDLERDFARFQKRTEGPLLGAPFAPASSATSLPPPSQGAPPPQPSQPLVLAPPETGIRPVVPDVVPEAVPPPAVGPEEPDATYDPDKEDTKPLPKEDGEPATPESVPSEAVPPYTESEDAHSHASGQAAGPPPGSGPLAGIAAQWYMGVVRMLAQQARDIGAPLTIDEPTIQALGEMAKIEFSIIDQKATPRQMVIGAPIMLATQNLVWKKLQERKMRQQHQAQRVVEVGPQPSPPPPSGQNGNAKRTSERAPKPPEGVMSVQEMMKRAMSPSA